MLLGGRSTEHDASLRSYLGVMRDVESQADGCLTCTAVYYVSRQGKAFIHRQPPWPRSEIDLKGSPAVPLTTLIAELAQDHGFVFNLLHGNEGEDGAWQGIAEVADLRGSFGSVFASAITMNKWAQSVLAATICGPRLRHPRMRRVIPSSTERDLERIVQEFDGYACVVKPNRMGASLLTERYDRLTIEQLRAIMAEVARFDPEILVQEYIAGTEYTCGCIERQGQIVALPLIQAVTQRQFLGHAEKHRKGMVEARMIREDTAITAELKQFSRQLFREFDLSTMCRFDYIVTDAGESYYLEANSIPGLMPGSAFPKMLAAAGFDCADLVRLSIEAAERRVQREKVLPYTID